MAGGSPPIEVKTNPPSACSEEEEYRFSGGRVFSSGGGGHLDCLLFLLHNWDTAYRGQKNNKRGEAFVYNVVACPRIKLIWGPK